MKRPALLAAALLAVALPAAAGLLTVQGAAVLDQTGAQRTTFSTNETIGFQLIVNNGVLSPNRISFDFSVIAPNGNKVFRHIGNSVRGTVGNAASQISGLPISGFAQGPGSYTLKATASLDGITVEQDEFFTISSPNILLIYPPNGSQNLTDNPLSFQWYSSGASSYRVTVGDNPSLYNALFTQTAPQGSSSLTYPQNPSDTRQRLSAGQSYWWQVEGLDFNGNVVAKSQVPFSFSIASTAQTRDLAVTGLEVAGAPDSAGNIPFVITVKNQGNTTETNTPLRVTLGGLTAPGSPIAVPQMSPSDVKTFDVSAPIPTDMTQGLAIACLTIFDDSVANNCKTLAVTRPAALSSGSFTGASPELSGDQIWQAIQQILRDQGTNLDGYSFTSMEGSLTRDELSGLLDQLRQGQAQTSLSGPPLLVAAPPPPTAAPETTSRPPDESGAPAAPAEASSVAQEKTWTGVAAPMSPQTLAFTVTKEAGWQRLWKRLSDEPVPLIDFAEHLVVAVVGGGMDEADRVQIEDYRASSGQLTVRYRLVAYANPFAASEVRPAAPKTATPYTLVVIPRTVLKVRFERIKERANE